MRRATRESARPARMPRSVVTPVMIGVGRATHRSRSSRRVLQAQRRGVPRAASGASPSEHRPRGHAEHVRRARGHRQRRARASSTRPSARRFDATTRSNACVCERRAARGRAGGKRARRGSAARRRARPRALSAELGRRARPCETPVALPPTAPSRHAARDDALSERELAPHDVRDARGRRPRKDSRGLSRADRVPRALLPLRDQLRRRRSSASR